MIILGKKGIIDTKLINVKTFIESYNTLTQKSFITVNNQLKFQEIIDVSRLSTATKNNSIIYQIIVPIFEERFWKLLHYIAIPSKVQNNFIAPILENEYALKKKNDYIPVNYEYIKRYCRESPVGKICERTQPTIHFETENYNPANECETAIFKIINLTFIPLQDHNSYLIIPQNPIIIQTICESIGHIKITEPSIITSKLDCILTYNNNVMKIGGTVKEIEIKITNYSLDIPFDEHDIKLLDNFLPIVEQVTPDFKKYRNSFETISNQLENLKNQRRILSSTEIIFNVLKYLGYASLGIITLYILRKLGLFRCLTSFSPKNICIKIFCNETTVSNNTQPNRSCTVNEMELIRIENDQLELRNSTEATSSARNKEIGPPKIVRFGTKLNLRRGV
ncbi:hypothetical protein K0M31_006990 [Melipona bicolor]|nr:hypothetical protein K0M31_006990 [Melipona bicolor]